MLSLALRLDSRQSRFSAKVSTKHKPGSSALWREKQLSRLMKMLLQRASMFPEDSRSMFLQYASIYHRGWTRTRFSKSMDLSTLATCSNRK